MLFIQIIHLDIIEIFPFEVINTGLYPAEIVQKQWNSLLEKENWPDVNF